MGQPLISKKIEKIPSLRRSKIKALGSLPNPRVYDALTACPLLRYKE